MYAVAVGNTDLLPVFFIQWLILSVTPIIADVGLWFMKSPEPFVAPINDDVVFDCSLNVPAEVIRWRHGRKYLQQNRTQSQLVIKVENESQLGDYQCVAWIGASALASVPAKLTLAEMKPFPLHQPEKNYTVTAGNMVPIYCPPPLSNPAALIQYYHGDRKLSTPAVRILPTSNSLLLTHVTTQDSGIYTCSATNYITGQTMHSPFRVNLTVVPNQSVHPSAPKFLSQPQSNYIVQSGSNVTIECAAVGEPPPRVSWYKVGDTQRLPNNRSEVLPGGLHLRNIVLEDTGQYMCEIDNDLSPVLRHKVLLQVHEAPVIIREPNRTLVEEQEDTELSCIVSGTPIPTITWTLNGEPLEDDAHVMHSSGSKLILRRVQKRHAGIYQCFASNSVGTAYGSTMLQVSPKQIIADMNSAEFPYDQNENWPETIKNNRSGSSSNHNRGHGHGKKDHRRKTKEKSKGKHKESDVMVPPSKPNVTRLSDRSVMVRWHVPPNNGLSISFFKVQHREFDNKESGKNRSQNRWMTSNEDIQPHIRSYEVDRLETNRSYKFRIAAVFSNNDNKLSPNSAKFFLHQGTPAERSHLIPPTHLHAEALSPTMIQIEWEYLNSVRTPVDGFYVYYRATNNAGEYIKATVEGEKTRSFVITHLQPDTSYDIKIQSFTVGAASNFSTIVTHKTQVDPTTTTTEYTSRNDLKTPIVSVVPSNSSNTFHVVTILCVSLGGLLLVCIVVVLFCYFKQRTFNDATSDEENGPDKNTDNIMSIHQVEPVTMNGYANHNNHNGHSHNNHSSHNGTGNKMMNGSAVKTCIRNGYIAPHSHINITNNPLATDTKHEKNMMEMSYLSKYNNNCTIDRCGDSDSDCSRDINKWKTLEQRPTEKYV